MAEVSLLNATKRFGQATAVDNISLTIADGEFVALLGPTCAGKTTILRLIAGLEPLDAGSVRIGGHDVSKDAPAMRDVAFVFQQYSLYPHLTVYDNLAFPLRAPARRVDEAEIRKRVERVAQLVRIDHKLANSATRLSGGEMQRVAIGRALVREPRVYLMDEPLSSLDAALREELRVELKRLQRASGATVVYVTHDQVEATTLADRIAILERGRLQQLGTPLEIYDRPRTLEVAQRLGSPAVNVLPAAWFAGSADPHAAHVAIRPEDVVLAPDDEDGDAQAYAVVECSLVKHLVVAERLGVAVRARTLLDQALVPGARVRLAFPPERCMYFDASGQRLAA